MIDHSTYRQMHPQQAPPASPRDPNTSQEAVNMDSEEPPTGVFCILLPPTMLGYGFHDKKWSTYSSRVFWMNLPLFNAF